MSGSSERLEQLLAAANAASARARTAWLAHLSLLAYLLIAVGATTHRDLLLGTSIRLPILQADVPLVAFYVLAPVIVWLAHLNLLIDLRLLAAKLERFASALERAATGAEPEMLRGRLDLFVFSQVRAVGGHEPALKLLMRFIVFVTTIVAPLLLLLAVQIRFLPYHGAWLTDWHRLLIVLDLGLLIALPPLQRAASGGSPARRLLPSLRNPAAWNALLWRGACWLGAAGVIVVSLSLATIPDEWLDRHLRVSFGQEHRAAPSPLLARYLVVSDLARRNDENEPVLVGRDLNGASLVRMDFRGARLSAVALQGARLTDSVFAGADFGCAEDSQSDRVATVCADLRNADLRGADLSGAKLSRAALASADLSFAKLTGADLNGANLTGASLRFADLSGADLTEATLIGADLTNANLAGVVLTDADLEGASLLEADLSGAHYSISRRFGTTWVKQNLSGVDLRGSTIWRFKIPDELPDEKTRWLELPDVAAAWAPSARALGSRRTVEAALPPGALRNAALERLGRLSTPWPEIPDDALHLRWRALAKKTDAPDRDELALYLAELACRPGEAPHVARGLYRRAGGPPLPNFSRAAFGLRIGKLYYQHQCPGVVGLTKDELETLLDWGRTGHP